MGDLYQSEHMAKDEEVRHQDKRVSRGMAGILGIWAPLSWALAAFIAVANESSSRPVPTSILPLVVAAVALLGFLFLGMAVTFAVLRTVVTETHVLVKYGLWGPDIPLASITACRVVDYDWTKYGGWGIRRGPQGWAYVPGPGEVVELEYLDEGVPRTVQIGAGDARKLSLEINRAREQARRHRVEVDLGEAERDAAAVEERAEEERVEEERVEEERVEEERVEEERVEEERAAAEDRSRK
ncbi:MAG: hypothetical protein R3B72_09675 [Polyangiaceae bacterium]